MRIMNSTRERPPRRHRQWHGTTVGTDDGGDSDDSDSFVDNKKEQPPVHVTRLVRIAQRIEDIQIPRRRLCCLQRLVKKYGTLDQPSGGSTSKHSSCGNDIPQESSFIPLISGLSQVVSGASPAFSASVQICTIRPPRYLFYASAGFLCDIVQLFVDVAVHIILGVQDPSCCWAIGFALSIVARHSCHRYFTFGAYVGGYWKSLGRMYAGYSIVIALSTAFNYIMTKMASMPHYVAFIVTLLWTGIVNYFILKHLWSFGGSKSGDSQKSKMDNFDSSV